jgi:pyrroline-5-carboxylate reductase
MAGITVDAIKKQTGSNNVVRIIPTGPDTISNSTAVAGVYGENKLAYDLFDLLDFDYIVVDDEDKMNYITIAGCLPAIYCRVDPDSEDNIEAVSKISEDFPEFYDLAKKCEKLVPDENKEEFVSNVTTRGGVTQAIINGLISGKSLYDSLMLGIERNKELSK